MAVCCPRTCVRQLWDLAVCALCPVPVLAPLSRGPLTHGGIIRARIHDNKPYINPDRPVCRVRAFWLARRRCERRQAHTTVTPDIGPRTAFQRSYRVPCARSNTSVSSWPTHIGVRAILEHVGAHEMHDPVGHLSEIATWLQTPGTYESGCMIV